MPFCKITCSPKAGTVGGALGGFAEHWALPLILLDIHDKLVTTGSLSLSWQPQEFCWKLQNEIRVLFLEQNHKTEVSSSSFFPKNKRKSLPVRKFPGISHSTTGHAASPCCRTSLPSEFHENTSVYPKQPFPSGPVSAIPD